MKRSVENSNWYEADEINRTKLMEYRGIHTHTNVLCVYIILRNISGNMKHPPDVHKLTQVVSHCITFIEGHILVRDEFCRLMIIDM